MFTFLKKQDNNSRNSLVEMRDSTALTSESNNALTALNLDSYFYSIISSINRSSQKENSHSTLQSSTQTKVDALNSLADDYEEKVIKPGKALAEKTKRAVFEMIFATLRNQNPEVAKAFFNDHKAIIPHIPSGTLKAGRQKKAFLGSDRTISLELKTGSNTSHYISLFYMLGVKAWPQLLYQKNIREAVKSNYVLYAIDRGNIAQQKDLVWLMAVYQYMRMFNNPSGFTVNQMLSTFSHSYKSLSKNSGTVTPKKLFEKIFDKLERSVTSGFSDITTNGLINLVNQLLEKTTLDSLYYPRIDEQIDRVMLAMLLLHYSIKQAQCTELQVANDISQTYAGLFVNYVQSQDCKLRIPPPKA